MGKTITYFLIDDDANGRIKCTYSNWTGIVEKLPKNLISQSDDRNELNFSGVYLLIGNKEVYVGQSNHKNNGCGVLERLRKHLNDKEKSFHTAIVITTTDNSLGATEISYLENTLYNILKNACLVDLINKNEPTIGNIGEEKQSEMNDFLNTAITMCETLGFFIFKKEENANEKDDGVFYYKNAVCRREDDGFLVLKNSKVATIYKDYAPVGVKNTKAKIDENGILLEDIFFKSASYAASFVTGRSENGLIAWKNKNGKTLKELSED